MQRLVAPVLAALLVAVGAGCEAETRTAAPEPVKLTPGPPEPPPPGPGRFYVTVGATDLAADLYEMRFSPLTFQRLTTDSRVTTISGCAQSLIVSAAQREVGYADRLQEFRDGKLQPIPRLGTPPASTPEVAPDCRILYYEQARATASSSARSGCGTRPRAPRPPWSRATPTCSVERPGAREGGIAVLRRGPGASRGP